MDDKDKGDDDSQATKGTARSTLGGAVAGAVAGTALGLPVVGTVIGAVSGAVIGAAKKRAAGTRQKAKSAKKAHLQHEDVGDKKEGPDTKTHDEVGIGRGEKTAIQENDLNEGTHASEKDSVEEASGQTSSRREVAEDRIWKGSKESSAPPGPEIGACSNGLSASAVGRCSVRR